mmetsp:Transcript_45318/g.144215  ORF Transcript_45318/g.144215 Transcript_45318/m.144215 type:complete len:202 (-) Transcript_45318:364-969(-)
MKIAELGSDLDIFSWPWSSPMSMWCERMMGLFFLLGFITSQYSRASMFTLRWSMPSWQISALRKKMSAACMHGYMICAALSSSVSLRPMIWLQRITRCSVFLRAMSSTMGQYSWPRLLISSLDQRNSTLFMSMPMAFHTSIMYFPTIWIFLMSPPILLFIRANQSATQNLNVQPALVSLFTLRAFITPCAMCMRPEGSNPS